MIQEFSMKPYKDQVLIFPIQLVVSFFLTQVLCFYYLFETNNKCLFYLQINIKLLMLDIQIREGILLHTKAQIFVIVYRIFDVDTRLLFVNLVDRKRNLTISTHHCRISLNELLECGKLGGRY